MKSYSFEFTIPVKSTHLGQITLCLPSIPVMTLCACCSSQQGLIPTTTYISISGYKPGFEFPYVLCDPCRQTDRHNKIVLSISAFAGSLIAIGLMVAFFWKTVFATRQPFLTIGASIAAGALCGSLIYYAARRRTPGPPHTACADAVSGKADQSGALGAFGVGITPGILKVQLTFANPQYGILVQQSMRDLGLPAQ